ncbi:T9SS type A sorting domain-containing protein [Flavobacterium pedocola]
MQLLRFLSIGVGLFSFGVADAQQPGSLDIGFGNGGKVITNVESYYNRFRSFAQSVAVQSDGKIVVVGVAENRLHTDDFALARYNNNGSLDATFGSDGKVTTSFIGSYSVGQSIAIQGDGKIVVAGYSSNGSYDADFAMARYNNDGSLDTTFGIGGKVTTDFGNSDDIGYSVAIQSDGKILVAGVSDDDPTTNTHDDFALVRYNSNGSLDTTFGSGGKVKTPIGDNNDVGQSIAIRNDGRIVVAGYSRYVGLFGFYNNDFALVCYNTDGSLDASFGSGGKVITAIGSDHDYGHSVVIQNDGKIVVTGVSDNDPAINNTHDDFALVRYNSNGSLDTTFSSDGIVTTDFGNSDDDCKSVALQNDGKIVVAGYTSIGLALARYNSNGSLDNTFSSDGKVISSSSNGNSVVVQNDGKVVVVGSAYTDNSPDFALVRYNSNGNLDTTFDTDGIVITPFIFLVSVNDFAQSIAIQSDGKIVVAGYSDFTDNHNLSNNDIVLARYDSNGNLDATFGSGGKVITGFGSGRDIAQSMAIQNDGKIIVAGHSDGDFALWRYNNNGSLDTTFGSGGKVTTSVGIYDDAGKSVAIQSDGKIIIAGNSRRDSGTDFALVRYNNDGSLDTTFGSGGKVTTNFNYFNTSGESVAIQSDGKNVVAGYHAPDFNFGYDFALARYNSDGSLDTTFDTDGKVVTDFGSEMDHAYSVFIQIDGKIVVKGNASENVVLVRYNSNGSFDATFGSGGKVNIGLISFNSPMFSDYSDKSVFVQSNGKIVAVGSIRDTSSSDTNIDFGLVRCNSNGSLNTTFGSGGKVTTDMGGVFDYGQSAAIQNDGKIVVAGVSSNGFEFDFALARYNGDETLGIDENSFVNNTIKVYPNPFSGTATVSFTLNESEKVSLRIFDLNGRVVKNISENVLAAGSHLITFDGEQLNSGIYLLQLKGQSFSNTQKMVNTK